MYDETYFSEKVSGSGRAVYIKRNYQMIDQSHFCVIYFDENNIPATRESGTKIALEYAIKSKKEVIIFS